MNKIRNVESFSLIVSFQNVSSVILNRGNSGLTKPTTAITAIMVNRFMSVHEVTKNIRLYTNEERKIIKNPKTLR